MTQDERIADPAFVARFWSHVSKSTPSKCWNWTASLDGKGYGKIKVGRKLVRASRVSMQIETGINPGEWQVLHTCDNRKCVNPSHLYHGTHADNMADMIARGRHRNGSPVKRKLVPRISPSPHLWEVM